MSDLISREALMDECISKGECAECRSTPTAAFCNGCSFFTAIEAIRNAPAVDAVEVVRCKDCLHWIDGVCGNFSNEDGSDYFTPAHGYCYAAEKEDSDEAD